MVYSDAEADHDTRVEHHDHRAAVRELAGEVMAIRHVVRIRAPARSSRVDDRAGGQWPGAVGHQHRGQ